MARPKNSAVSVTSAEIDLDAIAAREAEVAQMTDEEIMARLAERFEILDNMTRAVKSGDVNAMIVSGPPGVGKSYGVEKVLNHVSLFDKMAQKKDKFEIVKGSMTAIGLYCKLYEYSAPGSVVVFDDCDSVLFDDVSLNVLKAALDSNDHRFINWNADSRILRAEDIPNRFEFKGAAIFITNIKFQHIKSKKLKDHLNALESRCHYIDLEMDTVREKLLHIRQTVDKSNMLERHNLGEHGEAEVIQFISDNAAQLRELSLRQVLKIADLRKSFPSNWQQMARATCMRRV